ncbi:MAG TPA: hypothetical protein K8W01_16970 [Methylorubrum populi]|uniref:Uncharacterized protein n=1 Tax=Methylorubrum populi TaxID=223967 RepID=A0A921E5L2_9HYPH|nr:hypothetical protein [Methylorubrum populi]
MRASLFRLSLGTLCLALLPLGSAEAAGKTSSSRSAESSAAQTVVTNPKTAWTAAEPANCSRVRRKLWQADEGWLVKTVTVCH